MITFNSTNIFVGYIKQLLESFNLPKMKVYKDDIMLCENQLYIKDDQICQCVKVDDTLELKPLRDYVFNKNYINYVTQATYTGNTYDSYTHEYLGNYLRFLRDYKKVNLMPLYNCFSNRYGKVIDHFNNFLYTDPNYKIIMIPVKFFESYTIAIDCDSEYDLMCGFYNSSIYSLDDDITSGLQTISHYKVRGSRFSDPYVFNFLKDIRSDVSEELLSNYIKHEDDLKLFIKLPFTNNSSIVVLEGNYLNSNDFSFLYDKDNIVNFKRTVPNRTVIPFKKCEDDIETDVTLDTTKIFLKTKLQLLELNAQTSFPFADKLIAYLLDNVICELDTIPDNIKRMQKTLVAMYQQKEYQDVGIPFIGRFYGKWDPKYQMLFYNFAIKQNLLSKKYDILGYVDKDIEKILPVEIDLYE